MAVTTKSSPEVDMLELITGHWRSRAVYTAARLGVAEALAEGPKSAADLATQLDVDADALRRLLRALASLGVFVERAGRFEHTPMSERLVKDRAGSMRSLALAIGGAPYRVWGELPRSIKTGKPAFEHVFGAPFFDYMAQNEDAQRAFDQAMVEQSSLAHAAIVAAYDFSGFGTIVDVGGGVGALMERILRKFPGPRGVIFDQPQVVSKARARLSQTDLAPRLTFTEGSFFESVPEGGDAYVLAMIIHDWNDADAAAILRNVGRAMAPGARVLLSELLIPPGNSPFFGKLLDLDMLVTLGGKERTAEEYRALFADAGLTLTRFVPAYGGMSALSVIEGTKK